MEPLVGHAIELAGFRCGRFRTRTLLETEHVRLPLAAFEPRQEIPLRAPDDIVQRHRQTGRCQLCSIGRVVG